MTLLHLNYVWLLRTVLWGLFENSAVGVENMALWGYLRTVLWGSEQGAVGLFECRVLWGLFENSTVGIENMALWGCFRTVLWGSEQGAVGVI
jgi:hypothetical protein